MAPTTTIVSLSILALLAPSSRLPWARAASTAVHSQPESKPAPKPDPESIGSLRNAKVAFPNPEGKTLTFLAGNLSDEQLAELKKVAPNLTILHALNRQQVMDHAAEANAIDARFATPEFLAKAPNLVWIQAMSAGVDHLVGMKPLADTDRIVLTNMRAVHGPAIADHSFAMLLTLTRNMREHLADQAKGQWDRADESGPAPIALQGRTMLVVGLGGIGTEIAQRAHGFGMRVTAIRRSDTPGPDYIERLGHQSDLPDMLKDADVVAVCLPLTKETENLFDSKMLASMKKGSYLINIARGPIVNTDALLGALNSGHLAGACLDVTDPEPLPHDHPLWKQPNVIITPHVASDADLTRQRRWALFKENVRRFAAGEPLMNVVDKKAGY